MNYRFDVVVIGDSANGNEAVKKIASASNAINIAFVSRTFKRKTSREFINVEYILDEVAFVDYKNRLFCCCLASGDNLFSTHLIVASGLVYAPFYINNKVVDNVFNTPVDIDPGAREQQAIVVGNTDEDIKLAIAVAKKYKYVYLCNPCLELNASKASKQKLESLDNLLVLPNATISKAVSNDAGLQHVELTTYSNITCSAIFVKTQAMPETQFIPVKIMAKDADGKLITLDNLESTIVPRCFATGSCTIKNTKNMSKAMYNTIISDFLGGIL